jgi:hypothetical protein
MPAPSTTLPSLTPCFAASALRSSKPSGSLYQLTPAAASRIAARALGDCPKALSLAPMRTRSVRPMRRSSASGATNGTTAGSASSRCAKRFLSVISA